MLFVWNSYVIRMSIVHTGMSLICHSYVTRMCPYIICMYSYVICMSHVCTRMSSVYHSYVLVCNGMSLVYTRMSSVCHCMSCICHSYVSVCHPYITRTWFYHEPFKLMLFLVLGVKNTEYWNTGFYFMTVVFFNIYCYFIFVVKQ